MEQLIFASIDTKLSNKISLNISVNTLSKGLTFQLYRRKVDSNHDHYVMDGMMVRLVLKINMIYLLPV